MITGFGLGNLLAVPLAKGHLVKYLTLVAAQEEASVSEAHQLLAAMQHPAFAPCSDAEIDRFRELVFRSEYLKDAGRIHGNRIDCSATAGKAPRMISRLIAGRIQQDGFIAYSNLVPFHDGGLNRPGMQLDTAYVVFGSHLPVVRGPFPIHVKFVPNNRDFRSTVSNPGEARPNSASDQKDVADPLSATYCSPLFLNCVTASAAVDEDKRGDFGAIAALSFLGGIAGALTGLVLSVLRRRSLTLEQQLRRAIAGDKLKVAYQPIVNLTDGQIVGAEALARWTNDAGASVSPDVFVKIAEESGFVGSITSLVVHRALNDFREVIARVPDFRLNVNVTAADLADPKFLPMLDEAVKRARVPASSLAIEVTESSTANQEMAMESIRLLRRRGHSIYIDDFGTGYSSLSYLLYLAVDTIKIDKAFTRAIGTESVTVAILPQIMAMARSLNLGVVVEGIETEQQALYFSGNSQRMYGQGWLFGRPLPATEFVRLLNLGLEPSSGSIKSAELRLPPHRGLEPRPARL